MLGWSPHFSEFLQAIGQHVDSTGLVEGWRESGNLGPRIAQQVLHCGDYNKAIHIHKLTFQAMWRILLPHIFIHMKEQCDIIKTQIDKANEEELLKMSTEEFQDLLRSFKQINEDNQNVLYWLSNLEMVEITHGLKEMA